MSTKRAITMLKNAIRELRRHGADGDLMENVSALIDIRDEINALVDLCSEISDDLGDTPDGDNPDKKVWSKINSALEMLGDSEGKLISRSSKVLRNLESVLSAVNEQGF